MHHEREEGGLDRGEIAAVACRVRAGTGDRPLAWLSATNENGPRSNWTPPGGGNNGTLANTSWSTAGASIPSRAKFVSASTTCA